MALRSTLDHPKLARLKVKLKINRWEAVGILESVWHFCGRFTPRGDIGKYSNEEIAAWIEWQGDPDELIEALISARWFDVSEEHRLLVHDWHKHADDATKLAVKRSGLELIVPTVSLQCPYSVPTVSGLPVPEPVPEPEPVPDSNLVKQDSNIHTVSKRFVKPTIQDLKTYFNQIGLAESPQRFFDYYESKGWVVGKSKMKCWKAAARTWLANRKEAKPNESRVLSAAELEMIQR